jgi:cysteine-rich repeat protein
VILALSACGDEASPNADPCGNGEIEGTEACDDGNRDPGDGCSSACTIEAGWSCPTVGGLPCTTVCGDGVVVGAETCDDGNRTPGDGCDENCRIEPGATENCDDGVDNDGNGLVDCEDPGCAEVCREAEICNDGVDNDGDGAVDCEDDDCRADPTCIVTSGEEDCSLPGDEDGNGLADCADPACVCVCGDGEVQGDEQCDSGEANSDTVADACRTTCATPSCGDAVIDTGEACDGSAPAGFLCEACQLVSRTVCGESAGLRTLTAPLEGEALLALPLGADAVDDWTPPASCSTLQGPDATVELTLPEAGTWWVEVSRTGSSARDVLSVLADCEASAPLSCRAATRTGPAVAFVTVAEAGSRILRIDRIQGAPVGQLRVRRIERVLQPGATCDPALPAEVCPVGQACREITGAFVCADPLPAPGGLGESCLPDAADAAGECVAGLVCERATQSCQADPTTTCAGRLSLDTLAAEADEDGFFPVPLAPSTGELRGRCERYPRVVALSVDSPGNEWVQVEVRSPIGAPVAVSFREACAAASSENFCEPSSVGELRAALWVGSAGAGNTLLISGFGPVLVKVQRQRAVANGGTCDPTGRTSRCAPGLECAAARCTPALAGSCGDPVPGSVAADGTIAGRGAALDFDTGSVTAAPRAGCEGTWHRQVFRFAAPATGQVVARLVVPRPDARVDLVTECSEVRDFSDACGASDVAERVFRQGQRLDVVVTSRVPAEGVLTVRQFVQADAGGTCTQAADCLPGLNCEGQVCLPPLLLQDTPCVLGASRCAAGLACLPVEEGFACTPSEAGNREPCDVLDGLPTCGGGFVCLREGDNDVALCTEEALAGTGCRESTDCSIGFACVAGRCSAVTGAGEGAACDVLTPGACAPGLRCEVPAAGSLADARCVDPASVCTESSTCTGGDVCFNSRCTAPARVDEPCSTGPEGPPCALGLTCGGSAGAQRCVVVGGGPGSECASSSACSGGLYCEVFSPGEGVCLQQRAEGQGCSLTGMADQCVAGTSCRTNTMALPVCQRD